MHIVQITDDFPPMIGGMAVHAWELSKALAKLGNRVTVITAVRSHFRQCRFMLPSKEMIDDVEILHLGQLIVRRHALRLWQTKRHLGRLESNPNTIMHLHLLGRPRLIRPLSSLPMVWTNHSSGFLQRFEDVNERPRLLEDVSNADIVTAPSRELAEKTALLGYPSNKVHYIPNGVDTERFFPPLVGRSKMLSISGRQLNSRAKKCVIVCARRFAPKNGIHVFLDALERIREEILQTVQVLFVGCGNIGFDEYRSNMLKRCHQLQQRCECLLLDRIDNQDMPRIYQYADFAVLPSLQEATSITGLEAMASGLPLVGTKVGGIPEIVVNERTGLLCPANDAAALCSVLENMIENKKQREFLGQNSRKRAIECFSWHRIAEQFIEVYKNAVVERRQTCSLS